MRQVLVLVLALMALLSGCEEGALTVIQAETPPGFAEGARFEVRHAVDGAREGRSDIALETPLLDPINILAVPSGVPPSQVDRILVAEAAGWKVLSYPVESSDPLRLGAPEVVVTTEAWREGAVRMPATARAGVHGDLFGRILVLTDSGELIVSGPEGELWVARPGWAEAHRLGAGEPGAALDDGVAIGAADLSAVVGADFDPGGVGAPPSVILVSDNAVFSLPVSGLTDPSAILTRVFGSGARGESSTGDLARTAPLSLIDHAPVGVDGRGNLFLLETDAGRVLMVRDYRNPDARVVRLAGLGRGALTGDSGADALNLALEVVNTPRLNINVRLGGFDLDFLQSTGIPWRVSVDHPIGDLEAMEVESGFILAKVLPLVGGYLVLGDTIVAGRGDFGALGTYRAGQLTRVDTEFWSIDDFEAPGLPSQPGPLVETPLTGPAARDRSAIDNTYVPSLVRPGPVLSIPVFGSQELIIADSGSGHVMLEHPGGLDAFIFRSAGTRFSPYRSIAVIPETDALGVRLLLGTRSEVLSYSIERPDATPTLFRRGFTGPSLNGTPLGAWRATKSPVLVGVLDDGTILLLDREREVIFTLEGSAPLTPTTSMERFMGGEGAYTLPRDRTSGSTVIGLEGVISAELSAEGVLTVVLARKTLGDIVLAVPMVSEKDLNVAGQLFERAGNGIVVAGGGSAWPSEGVEARSAGLSGLTSAVATPDGSVWVSVRGLATTGLWRIDDEGLLRRVADPRTTPPVEGDEANIADLVVPGSATLAAAPCLPGGVVALLTDGGVWALNLGLMGRDSALLGRLESGRARKIASGTARSTFCRPDGSLALLDASGEALLVPGQEAAIMLDAPVDDLMTMASGGILAAVQTPEGGALLQGGPEALLDGVEVPRISGSTPSVFDGRQLFRSNIAGDLPIFAAGPDGLIYGALSGLIFRVLPSNGRFSKFSFIEVVWSGEPVGDTVTAMAVEDDGRILVAARGRLYRLTLDEGRAPTAGDDRVNRGVFELLAGGGDRVPGLGGLALNARMGPIEGIAPVGDRVVLRWGGYIGFLESDGTLVGIGGGGDKTPFEAEHPWELSLAWSVGIHPALAVTRGGEIVTSDARSGTVLSFELPR